MTATRDAGQSGRGGGARAEGLRVPLNWEIVSRICVQYIEMPGLRLSVRQAQRLWGLDETTCSEFLGALVEVAFLWRMNDGQYARC
jgi:hypothetical protein